MTKPTVIAERLIVLFALGLLLFNPPLLTIFDNGSTINGLPVLYAYLFFAWLVLIGLLALGMRGAFSPDKSDDSNLTKLPPSQQMHADRPSGKDRPQPDSRNKVD